MTLYYQDEHVTLHHGDSLEILPTLDVTADVLLTDPPYFKVKQDEWDNQWDKAGEFLGWMGEWLDHAKPLLAPHASAWVFASPAMTSSVERVVSDQFRVLNSVRWVKEAGWHQKSDLKGARRYLTPWEGIILAEHYANAYHEGALSMRTGDFAPIGRYIQQERERAGWDGDSLEVALGFVRKANPKRGTELCRRWEEGSSTPSREVYQRIRGVLGGDYLGREYDDLVSEQEALRRPFNITERALSTDVWTFPAVRTYKGKHPCEKPQAMLTHMIETSSRPGWTILDPFAGSGSTLRAAKNSGRKALGIEKDEAWCEKIAQCLSENTLELGATA